MTTEAIERTAVPHPDEFFIGGAWVEPSRGEKVAVVSPCSGLTLVELPDPAAPTPTGRTKYGLASSIYANDARLAVEVAGRVEVGAFAINGGFPCLTSPYGGLKQSGYGRSSGVEGLLNLTQIKSIIDYSA